MPILDGLAINHILPCGDILTKYYPDLYNNIDVPCPFCNNQKDTNEHLGLCSNLLPTINDTLHKHKKLLAQLIEDHTPTHPPLFHNL